MSNALTNFELIDLIKDYKLDKHCSLLINVSEKEIINIKSNCLFLRPTVFSYKDNYLDVHHS